MEIYLFRHGAAERHSSTGRDADRRLTAEGQAEVRRMARRIAVMGVAPSLILASPYARAAETAGIAADVLSYDGEILPAPCLVPDSRPADVWNEIRSHPQASSLLLVGHEPLLSTTLAWMLGVANAAQFPTAGLARVDAEPSPVARASMRFRIAPSDA